MENQEIQKKVFDILGNFTSTDPSQFNKEMEIMKDLGMDSFAIVEMMYEIEIELGVKVPNEDLPKIITIENLINYINTHE